jgi:hypothetical protein
MLKQSRDLTLTQRTEAALALQGDLRELKKVVEQAMAGTLALSGRFIEERSVAALPVALGHSALNELAAANAGITQALGHIITAHREMAKVAGDVGVQITAWGPLEDSGAIEKPKAERRLQAVR